MGFLILLFLFVIPVFIVFYIVYKVESKRPHGMVDYLRDKNGNQVMGEDGKPLIVDEHGKVVSYDQGVAHVRRGINSQRTKEGCLFWIMGFWLAHLFSKNK